MRTRISVWDAREVKSAVDAIIVGELPFEPESITLKFSKMKDKRGTFAAIEIVDAPKGEKKKYRLKRPYESLKPYMGERFEIVADMCGWRDCSMSEWWQLAEIIDKMKLQPPRIVDIYKELTI